MTALPAAGEISQQKSAAAQQVLYENQRDVISELPGGLTTSPVLTIAGGAITPVTGFHTVDTEGAAPTDTLLTMVLSTHTEEGRLVYLASVDAARVITVQEGGNILTGGRTFTLDPVQPIAFQRKGSNMVLVGQARLPVIVDTFTAGGVWTKRAGLLAARVTVIHAGAGGGAATGAAGSNRAGGGGGGGGAAIKWFDAAALGATETVVVGTGGTGSTGAGAGNGPPSQFGGFLSGSTAGGGQDSSNNSGLPGSGSIGTGGDLNFRGGQGGYGFLLLDGTTVMGGSGGEGAVSGAVTGAAGNGTAGSEYGGGGSGGSQDTSSGTTSNGGDGADGVVYVENYF